MSDTAASARTPTKVTVDLGPRSYDILIGRGVLDLAGVEIARRLPAARVAIVTDENVAGLHLRRFTARLDAAGVRHVTVTVRGRGLEKLRRPRAGRRRAPRRAHGAPRRGGGTRGRRRRRSRRVRRRRDAARHAFDPGADDAPGPGRFIGRRQDRINTERGKNLVGLFQQPDFVLADAGIVDSLPPRQFNAGYAEVVKYGLIGDAPFFDWLRSNWRGGGGGWPEREHAIAVSCRAKAATVAAMSATKGARALLNFGHTFAHALEAATGYSDRLVHGEAVAIGMVLAFQFSARTGLCPADDAARVVAHLAEVGLPTEIGDIPGERQVAKRLMELMEQDKKVSREGWLSS